MNSDKSDFYDTQAGTITYQAVLKHFKDQSSNSDKSYPQAYLAGYSLPTRKAASRAGLRIIKVSDPRQTQPDLPKLQVTDPIEAQRKRAQADLNRDTQGTITANIPSQVHTPSGRQKKNISQKRKQQPSAPARVKRARDIFDN